MAVGQFNTYVDNYSLPLNTDRIRRPRGHIDIALVQ